MADQTMCHACIATNSKDSMRLVAHRLLARVTAALDRQLEQLVDPKRQNVRAHLCAHLDTNGRTTANMSGHVFAWIESSVTVRQPHNHTGFGFLNGGGGIRTHE